MWCSGMCRVGKGKGVGVGRLGCGVLGLVCGSLCCAGWERFFLFPLLLSTTFNFLKYLIM